MGNLEKDGSLERDKPIFGSEYPEGQRVARLSGRVGREAREGMVREDAPTVRGVKSLRRRKSKRVSTRELSNPQWLGTDSRAEEHPEAGFPDLTSSSPPNTDDHHLRVGVMFRFCAFWRLRRCNMTPLCEVCRKTVVARGSIEPGWNWQFGDLCVSHGRNRPGRCPLKGVDASGDFCELWKRVGCRVSAGQDGRFIGGPSGLKASLEVEVPSGMSGSSRVLFCSSRLA